MVTIITQKTINKTQLVKHNQQIIIVTSITQNTISKTQLIDNNNNCQYLANNNGNYHYTKHNQQIIMVTIIT